VWCKRTFSGTLPCPFPRHLQRWNLSHHLCCRQIQNKIFMSPPHEGELEVKVHRISSLAIKSGRRWYHFCSVFESSHFRIWSGDRVNWLRFLVVVVGRYSENSGLVPRITYNS
jgi:hypothetical protein